ncbi:hypothetical protein ACB092_04G108100 [Castanea dentata]
MHSHVIRGMLYMFDAGDIFLKLKVKIKIYEYEKLFRRMNPPRVVIDNESCKNATMIRVDSENKHGILLEVVQVLTDLNFIITKAYISSDGGWFMDGKILSF